MNQNDRYRLQQAYHCQQKQANSHRQSQLHCPSTELLPSTARNGAPLSTLQAAFNFAAPSNNNYVHGSAYGKHTHSDYTTAVMANGNIATFVKSAAGVLPQRNGIAQPGFVHKSQLVNGSLSTHGYVKSRGNRPAAQLTSLPMPRGANQRQELSASNLAADPNVAGGGNFASTSASTGALAAPPYHQVAPYSPTPKRKHGGSGGSGGTGRRSGRSNSSTPSPRHSLMAPPPERPLPSFPTNFGAVIRDHPPPVPPMLLRLTSQSSTSQSYVFGKDFGGKVKVTLRVAPLSSSFGSNAHLGSPDDNFLDVDVRKKQVIVHDAANLANRKQMAVSLRDGSSPGPRPASVPKIFFGFDAVFSPEHSQTEVCSSALVEVLHAVVSGSDACLFSFGSGGPGLNLTMVGSDANAQSLGIIPSALSWLYRLTGDMKLRNAAARFSIRVTALSLSGPNEELIDLLAPFAGSDQILGSDPISIAEDSISGVQIQNVCEVRAGNAGRAAQLLDAALSGLQGTEDDSNRNSHLFFTIHLYQYKKQETASVDSNEKIAGGRSRLHLIDLGAGAKTTKAGQTALTMPAIAHVIVTLLQGQKHLPYRNSKLSQLLKHTMGTSFCKTVSAIACVSPDPRRYVETVNCVSTAARLSKIGTRKRGKFGPSSSGGSNSGESSGDDKRRRLRSKFPRSASDPDCTSSSEQSCADTVIFLGTTYPTVVRQPSDKDPNDNEAISRTHFVNKLQAAKQNLPTINETTAAIASHFGLPAFESSPILKHRAAGVVSKTMAVMPTHAGYKPLSILPKNNEIWVDGPRALKENMPSPAKTAPGKCSGEVWIDGPSCSPTVKPKTMDPSKREMIKHWVTCQARELQERLAAEEQQEQQLYSHETPFAPPATPTAADPLSAQSMETSISDLSSNSGKIVETAEIGIQIDEQEIDSDIAELKLQLGIGEDGESARIISMPDLTGQPQRYLEDIAEVEEDTSSGKRSTSASIDMPLFRNEAMACLSGADFMTASGEETRLRPNLKIPEFVVSEFEDSDHPLQALSLEELASPAFWQRTETPSMATGSLADALSLSSGSDKLDEDLEQAMRASMTSVRSVEVLAKLKTDQKLQQAASAAVENAYVSLAKESKAFQCKSTDGGANAKTIPVTITSTKPATSGIGLAGQTGLRKPAVSANASGAERQAMEAAREVAESFAIRNNVYAAPVEVNSKPKQVNSRGAQFLQSKKDVAAKVSSEAFEQPCSMQTFGVSERTVVQHHEGRLKTPKTTGQQSKLPSPPLKKEAEKNAGPQIIGGKQQRVEPHWLKREDSSGLQPLKDYTIFTAKPAPLTKHQSLVPELPRALTEQLTSQLVAGLATAGPNQPSSSVVTSAIPGTGKQKPSTSKSALPKSPSMIERLFSPKAKRDDHPRSPSEPAQSLPTSPTKSSRGLPQSKLPAPPSKAAAPKQTPRASSVPKSGKLSHVQIEIEPKPPAAYPLPMPEARLAQLAQAEVVEDIQPKSHSLKFLPKFSFSSSNASSSGLRSPTAIIRGLSSSPVALRSPTSGVAPKVKAVITTSKGSPGSSPGETVRGLPVPQLSKRASSGYDSGHDSGIVVASHDKSPSEFVSPYHKVTTPKVSQRTSSGHGSDCGSALSGSEAATPNRTRLTLNFMSNRGARNRDSVAASSGYESSGGGHAKSDTEAATSSRRNRTPDTSPSDVSGAALSPRSAQKFLGKYFKINFQKVKKTQSAPSSTAGKLRETESLPANDRLYESQPIDKNQRFAAKSSLGSTSYSPEDLNAFWKRNDPVLRDRLQQINRIKLKQEVLKSALADAKDRIGAPPNKWSYELHVEKSMDPADPNIIEALEQETKILEKRVTACRAHAMLVTVFDSKGKPTDV